MEIVAFLLGVAMIAWAFYVIKKGEKKEKSIDLLQKSATYEYSSKDDKNKELVEEKNPYDKKMDDFSMSEAQQKVRNKMSEERKGFIQHISDTAELRQQRRIICNYLDEDRNKELNPDEYEKKTTQKKDNDTALIEINQKFIGALPPNLLKAYKKFSASFNFNLNETWFVSGEHVVQGGREMELKDCYMSNCGYGGAFLGYNNPQFDIGDYIVYFFPMYVAICKDDASWFELIPIEDVSVTYEEQLFREKRHLVVGTEVKRYIYIGDYSSQSNTTVYSRDVMSSRFYGKLTFLPFDITIFVSKQPKGIKIFNAINEYIDFIKSMKGVGGGHAKKETTSQAVSREKLDPTAYSSCDDYTETIEVTYSVFGHDELGETSFDMDLKDGDYEWLEDTGILDSDYIAENRKGLHKRIIRAIRKNMEEESIDPDDGMVEVYVSGCHRKEYHEKASYEHAQSFAEDDDIEYTVSL